MCQILKLLTIFFLKKINKDINVKNPKKKKESMPLIQLACQMEWPTMYGQIKMGLACARWTVVGPCKVMGYNQCN